MNNKLIVVLISIVSMLGCTTMQPLRLNQVTLDDELRPGSKLVLHMKSGQILNMKLESFDGNILQGTSSEKPSSPLEIYLQDVRYIEAKKVDGAKTLKIAGGVLLLVLISAALVAGSSAGNPDFNWTGGGSN